MSMTEPEVKAIADAAAEAAVRRVLQVYGIDVESPKESQADMDHLRRWRKAVNTAQSAGFVTTLTILITGVCGMLWLGLTFALGRPPVP